VSPLELCKNTSILFSANTCHNKHDFFGGGGTELARKSMIFLCQKCTKMHSLTQNTTNIFWGGGTAPSPDPAPLALQTHSTPSAPMAEARPRGLSPQTHYFFLNSTTGINVYEYLKHNTHQLILPTRRYASAGYAVIVCLFVSPSITSRELFRNG